MNRISKVLIATLSLAAGSLWLNMAQAASFDCAKARTKVEKMNEILIKRLLVLAMVVLGAFVLASPPLYAAGTAQKHGLVTNIGFMKHPPKAWVKEFPMCDAFLKVKWFDAAKGVGYSVYNLYVNGKKSKRTFAALVFVSHGRPHYDYDVDKWRKDGTLPKIFREVKNANNMAFYFYHSERIPGDISLADHRENVCVPYPSNLPLGYIQRPGGALDGEKKLGQRMWLAEMKEVGDIYSEKEIVARYKRLSNLLGVFPYYRQGLNTFKAYKVLDLNMDGTADFIGDRIIYTYKGRYYKARRMWKSPADPTWGDYYFPTSHKSCFVGILSRDFYLATDGKSYYLENSCNLTALMR